MDVHYECEELSAEETWRIGNQPVPQQAACAVLQMQNLPITDTTASSCVQSLH